MGKKKENGSKTNKKEEPTVKVDSKGAEPKKVGKKIDEPLYDVYTDGAGNSDIVLEEVFEDADFPPELADFLTSVIDSLRGQLKIPDNEAIPEKELKRYFEQLLAEVSIDELADTLGFNRASEPEDDDFADFEDLEDLEDDDDFEEFGTEEELLAAIEELPVEKDGTKIWTTIRLNDSDKTIGYIEINVPIVSEEVMVENNVIFKVVLPYIETIPFSAVKADANIIADKHCLGNTDTFYVLEPDVADSYGEILAEAGHSVPKQTSVSEIMSQIEKASARPNGYYDDLMEYWYEGKVYHEKDAIWVEIPCTRNGLGSMKGFIANIDIFGSFYTACDISGCKDVKVENGQRVLSKEETFEAEYYGKNVDFLKQLLPSEEVWWIASEFAKTKTTPGYVIVCLDGKFYVPTESFMNCRELETDNLLVMFNVTSCLGNHHNCAGALIADVGNMQTLTYVRYKQGKVLDWNKRIQQEIAAYRSVNPNFDPYDDPYDDPHNAYGFGFDDFDD